MLSFVVSAFAAGVVVLAGSWAVHRGPPTGIRAATAFGLLLVGLFPLGMAVGIAAGYVSIHRPEWIPPPHEHFRADTHLRL